MLDIEVDLVGDSRAFDGLCGLSTEEGRDGDHNESEGKATEHFGLNASVEET
jgi:hypothetical protein